MATAWQATWKMMQSVDVGDQVARIGHLASEHISYIAQSKKAITCMMFILLGYVTCISYDGHSAGTGGQKWTALADIVGANSTKHKQYCMYAAARTEPALFLDSCCSTTMECALIVAAASLQGSTAAHSALFSWLHASVSSVMP